MVEHVVHRYFRMLLDGYADPPYVEKDGRVEWVLTASPTISVLPLLIHGAGQLAIMCLTDTIAEVDAAVCIHHWLHCTETGFQDTKLKTQKVFRNWLPLALNRLPPQKVPVWSLTGKLLSWRTKDPRENAVLIKQLEQQREDGLAKLDPSVREYLDLLTRPKNFECLVANYHVARVIGNDGTFYASIPEVTIDAAVLPKVKESVLPSMRPSSHLTETEVLRYEQETSPVFARGFVYMKRGFLDWVENSKNTFSHLEHEIVSFLTTSSAGNVPEHLTAQLSADPRLKSAAKKRIVAFVGESNEMLNLERFRDRLTEPVYAVERVQVGRRARAVAGVNNPRILASLPYLRAAEVLQKVLRHASSGKQTGSIVDLARTLHWSSCESVLMSSMDVSGFDASVQMASQIQFITVKIKNKPKRILNNRSPYLQLILICRHLIPH